MPCSDVLEHRVDRSALVSLRAVTRDPSRLYALQ
jgi:hypothetical protein